MKKLMILGIVAVMTLAIGVGCTEAPEENIGANESEEVMAKIAINIEGTVAEVDGNRITLDTGKVVIITDDTDFETENIGEILSVNDNIEVGNFIQGFTFGDPEANEVTADVINSNGPAQINSSVIVNIEGIIVEVSEDGKSFLLDNGKWIKTTDETEMGIDGPTAAPKDEQFFEDSFRVGNSIAGFTEDENADEIIAYAIYTNWNWENPVKEIIPESNSEIIKDEIIIGVTSEYDGTITEELKNLNVVSVENIFDVDGTVMYLLKTDIYVDDIIKKLEELSYVKYAEYNMLTHYIDPILDVQ